MNKGSRGDEDETHRMESKQRSIVQDIIDDAIDIEK
jgi:hypothetical protein